MLVTVLALFRPFASGSMAAVAWSGIMGMGRIVTNLLRIYQQLYPVRLVRNALYMKEERFKGFIDRTAKMHGTDKLSKMDKLCHTTSED
jgi:hypothetical protein